MHIVLANNDGPPTDEAINRFLEFGSALSVVGHQVTVIARGPTLELKDAPDGIRFVGIHVEGQVGLNQAVIYVHGVHPIDLIDFAGPELEASSREMLRELAIASTSAASWWSENSVVDCLRGYQTAIESHRDRFRRELFGTETPSPRSKTVSVVIPAYNLENYVGDAIRSVQNQSIKVDEIFVCDDCSTDATVEVAEALGVSVLQGPKGNGSVARNRGAKAATGEILMFLDGDDWWHPYKVESHLTAHELNPDASFVYEPARVVEMRSITHDLIGAGLPERPDWPDFLDWRAWASGSCFSVRRDRYWSVQGFNEKLIALQDVDFWIRSLHAHGPAYRISHPLTYYRILPKSVSKSPRNVESNMRLAIEGWPFLSASQTAAFERQTFLTAARWCRYPEGLQYLKLAGWPVHQSKFWKVFYRMVKNTLRAS